MFDNIVWSDLGQASVSTLYMVFVSTLLAAVIGLPIGILLFLWSKHGLLKNRVFYQLTSVIVNIVRSVPFIILLIALIPFTEWLTGTSIGTTPAIVPLVIGAAPFFARIAETAFREVDRGVIEAAKSMGASTRTIICRVLLPEARPGLVAGLTLTAITLVGYTAMSGVVGGGGLGNLAVMYGYERFETNVMIITTVILLIFVQVIQMIGDRIVRHFSH